MRICLAALGVGLGTMLIAACSGGTATSTAASANAQVCAGLQSASSALTTGGSETVAQAQEKLQGLSSTLSAAKSDTTGLGQALVVNLQARVDEALKSINGLAPGDSVPAGFGATQSKLGSGLSELSGKLKCN